MSIIWEDTDPGYMRAVKSVFFGLAVIIFGWWLLPLRDFTVKRGWRRLTWTCNNVPNGLSILRGIAAIPMAGGFLFCLWQEDTTRASTFFWLIAGLFLLDAIDGPLARMLDYQTQFGAEADPAADKVLIYTLAAALPFLIFRFQGWAASLAIIVILAWMAWVEQDIVRISLRTRQLSRQTREPIHGAFGSGKAKFCFQAVGFGLAYAWLITEPTSPWGAVAAGICFMVARFFGDKSRSAHRQEWQHFYDQVHVNTSLQAKLNRREA